jgi:hypothetical protein
LATACLCAGHCAVDFAVGTDPGHYYRRTVEAFARPGRDCVLPVIGVGYNFGSGRPIKTETIDVLTRIGNAVAIELGYHLCYGSLADEHCVQPKDMAVMVAIANAASAGITRPIQFFQMPVPKGRTADA